MWKYQLIFHDEDPNPYYEIHEITYLDEDNPDKITSFTEESVTPHGENLRDFFKDFNNMKEQCQRNPILFMSDLIRDLGLNKDET